MKCDTDAMACQPCRQNDLRCFTTDRVTGQARERGEADRAENELLYLREQLAGYQHRYGPLQRLDTNDPVPATPREQLPPAVPAASPITSAYSVPSVPDSRYVGWPAPDNSEPLRSGPVQGTVVDLSGDTIDIADWPCEMMEDYDKNLMNKFNLSWTSITNTICRFQRVEDLKLPSKEEGLRDAHQTAQVLRRIGYDNISSDVSNQIC